MTGGGVGAAGARRLPSPGGPVTFLVLAVWFTALAWVLDPVHLPLAQDEVGYLWQSRVFLSGRLAMPVPEEFESFDAECIARQNDRRFAVFYPGHSLVLAAAQGVGLPPWVVNPLLVAAALALAAGLASSVGGRGAGWLTVVSGMLSRTLVFSSTRALSEPAAMLLGVVFVRALVLGERGLAAAPLILWFRPITALAHLAVGSWAADAAARRRILVWTLLSGLGLAATCSLIAGAPAVSLYAAIGEGWMEPGWTAREALIETWGRIVWAMTDTAPILSPLLVLWTLRAQGAERRLRVVGLVWLALVAGTVGRLSGDRGFMGGRHLSPMAPLVVATASVALGGIARTVAGPLGPGMAGTALAVAAVAQLSWLDLPPRMEALSVRLRIDPRRVVERELPAGPAGRTLVLCRTAHYDLARPGRVADAYFLGFHHNTLDMGGPLVFARERDPESDRRLAATLAADTIVRLAWVQEGRWPQARIVARGPVHFGGPAHHPGAGSP